MIDMWVAISRRIIILNHITASSGDELYHGNFRQDGATAETIRSTEIL